LFIIPVNLISQPVPSKKTAGSRSHPLYINHETYA